MRTAIIGAGPAGLVLGAALARRGAQVTLVDRDPGPPAEGAWARKGVMQFHHAHAIRPQVVETLRRELREAYDRLLEVGAEPVEMPLPDGRDRGRRSAVPAQHLRAGRSATAVLTVPGVTLRTGHVDRVLETVDSGPTRRRDRRRRRVPGGGPGRRRLRPLGAGQPRPPSPGVGRRDLRHRLRRPGLPAGARCRTRPHGQPRSPGRRTATATSASSSSTSRDLLRAGHPLDRRP